MGRRNTQVEPDLPLKTKAKSLARVRSAGTLPWLGFDRAQPNRSLLPEKHCPFGAPGNLRELLLHPNCTQVAQVGFCNFPFAATSRA